MEVTLQIGLCRGSAVDFGVVVNEGKILALQIGIGGGIFVCVRDRHGVYFMIYYPFYHGGNVMHITYRVELTAEERGYLEQYTSQGRQRCQQVC